MLNVLELLALFCLQAGSVVKTEPNCRSVKSKCLGSRDQNARSGSKGNTFDAKLKKSALSATIYGGENVVIFNKIGVKMLWK